MKIDGLSNFNVFMAGKNISKVKISQQNIAPAHRTDIAEFSSNVTSSLNKDMLAEKSSILGDAARPTDPARIESIKQRISSGTYHVSTDALVDAILGKKI